VNIDDFIARWQASGASERCIKSLPIACLHECFSYGEAAPDAKNRVVRKMGSTSNLVKLNAERAEEERNGLIRWLRPDFQTKGESKPVQIEIERGPRALAPAAGTLKPWPKDLADRIAAVRACLRPSESRDLETIAAQFKRAQRKDVASVLDALAALGLAVAYDLPKGRVWRRSARRAA